MESQSIGGTGTISTFDGKTVMMEMEIQFSKGRVDRILVFYGDEPTQIATDFVSRHSLKERTIPAISKHIENTIETFLATKASNEQNNMRSTNSPEDESKTINTGSQSQSLNEPPVDRSIRSLSDLTENKLESIDAPYRSDPEYIQTTNDEVAAPQLLPPVHDIPSKLQDHDPNNDPDMPLGNLYPPPVEHSMENPIARPNVPEGIALSPYRGRSSRSLPLTIDPKQFQENIDRNMDLRSFSYPKIAAELIASASSESKDKRDPHAPRGPDPRYKYYHSGSYHPVQHAWQPLDGGISSDARYSQRPFMTSKSQDEDDKQYENVSDDLSVSRSASDADDNSDDDQGTRRVDDAEALREFDAEEMYNRIRDAYYAAPRASQSVDERSHMNTMTTRNSTIAPLKPSSNSMQLYTTRLQPDTNRHRLVGKNTNERLYISAQMKREKQLRLEKQRSDELTQSLAMKQFKASRASDRIVRSVRPPQQQGQSVCERLHDDGVLERKMKLKRAEDQKDQLQYREWSCAKCGKMHTVSRAQVYIQPLHQVLSNALSKSHSDDGPEDHFPDQICSYCHWNQSRIEQFRPVNIGLVLAQDIQGSGIIEPDEMSLSKRWHGREDAADGLMPHGDNTSSIHDYLYANARTKQGISQLNRALHEESNPDLTFSPRIPQGSQSIIDKYKHASLQQSSSSRPTSPSNSYLQHYDAEKMKVSSSNINNNNMISGAQIGAYLSMPATERLASTKLSSNNSSLLTSMQSLQHHQHAFTEHKLLKNPEEFTNRLVYEYKEKSDRIAKKREESMKFDPKTGQPMFRPKIGPPPDESMGYGGRSTISCDNITDAFEKIMYKDEQLKSKRKEAEEKAIRKQLDDLAAMKVKPLDNSKTILQQSNKRNAKELFAVLLHAQQELINRDPSLFNNIDLTDAAEVLFLDHVDTGCMLDHVAKLVNNIKDQQNKQSSKPYPANGVTFDGFKRLALVCVNMKEGPGRGYICAPQKTPETALQMIKAQERELTFAPTINETSKQLCAHRINDRHMLKVSVENMLQLEGEKAKLSLEEMRKELAAKELQELTFKPTLYKAPSYVRPKYRGLESHLMDLSDVRGDDDKLKTVTHDELSVNATDIDQRDVEILRLASGSTITSASQNRNKASAPMESKVMASSSSTDHRVRDKSLGIKRTSSSPSKGRLSMDNFSSPLSHASDDDLTVNTQSTSNNNEVNPPPPHQMNSKTIIASESGLQHLHRPTHSQSASLMHGGDTVSSSIADSNNQLIVPQLALPPLPHELQKMKSAKNSTARSSSKPSNASKPSLTHSRSQDKVVVVRRNSGSGQLNNNNNRSARISSVSGAVSTSTNSTSIKKNR